MAKKNPGISLKLPNLKYYFWTAQMKRLIVWIQNSSYTRWHNIERNMCPQPLQIPPFLDTPVKEMAVWTKTTIRIWNKIQSVFGLQKVMSLLTSMGFVKTFTPNNLDIGFRKWSDRGLI